MLVLGRSSTADTLRIRRHLNMCFEDGKPGNSHNALTEIENEIFNVEYDVNDTAFIVDKLATVTASDIARLMYIAHNHRVDTHVCYSIGELRFVTNTKEFRNSKIRRHAQKCPFCSVYLPGSGRGSLRKTTPRRA